MRKDLTNKYLLKVEELSQIRKTAITEAWKMDVDPLLSISFNAIQTLSCINQYFFKLTTANQHVFLYIYFIYIYIWQNKTLNLLQRGITVLGVLEFFVLFLGVVVRYCNQCRKSLHVSQRSLDTENFSHNYKSWKIGMNNTLRGPLVHPLSHNGGTATSK